MTNILEKVGTTILVLCALVVTGLLVRRELFVDQNFVSPSVPVAIAGWQRFIDGDMRLGPIEAPVTVIVFSDFQCPFCRQFASTIDSVLAQYPRDVAVVFRNHPIQALHAFARPAAVAAECAADQGRFSSAHSLLFDAQDTLQWVDWHELGPLIDVPDISKYESCLSSPGTLARLRTDSLASIDIRLTGTPTVLVNGIRFPGTPSMSETFAVIDSILGVTHMGAE